MGIFRSQGFNLGLACCVALKFTGCSADAESPQAGATAAPAAAAGSPGNLLEPGATAGGPNVILDPAAGAVSCETSAALARGRIWRLSNQGYVNALGAAVDYHGIEVSELPTDALAANGFRTDAATNIISLRHSDLYFAHSRQAAEAFIGAGLAPEHSCITADSADAACVAAFISDVGSRVFRRPLTDAESLRYGQAYSDWFAAYGGLDASTLLVRSWLLSPHFLYRTEIGSGELGPVTLTADEIASQLSFLLTAAPPDAELSAVARTGTLTDKAAVLSQAERLLKSPQAREVVKDFFFQLLHLDDLSAGVVKVDAALVPAMIDESLGFVERLVFDQGQGLAQILSSDESPIDERLATLYGVTPAAAGALTRTGRAGVLHQAAFLNAKQDAVHRGMLRSEFLCSAPPPPPPNAAAAAAALVYPPDSTAQERFAIFNAGVGPGCVSCHSMFVPLGLAFEKYDATGAERSLDNGKAINTAGSVVPAGDFAGSFSDSVDLVNQIVKSDAGQTCFVKRLVSYSVGRGLDDAQGQCLLDSAKTTFIASELRITDVLLGLTQDPSFYQRVNML